MSVIVNSATLSGCKGMSISVEVNILKGLPSFNIVGLANTTIKESKERVRSAIANSGYKFPMGRIIVNLAPADVRKVGSLIDLPIAIGILLCSNQIRCFHINKYTIVGELSLDGVLRKVNGVLPVVINGIENGITSFIIPVDNIKEAHLIGKGNIYPFYTLKQTCEFLINEDLNPYDELDNDISKENNTNLLDYKDVYGEAAIKRALVIAAAGNHNLILYGPPGCGKSMIAQRITSILPPLDKENYIEMTSIYSSAGLLNDNTPIINSRPFRSPHHTITRAKLIGGGADLTPGEVTLAHKGVLFLDELPEFGRELLDALREPLENKSVNISRIRGSAIYPANFLLLGAMNPCPCGRYLNSNEENQCICSEAQRKSYIQRISKSFLDRIDMFVYVPSSKYSDISFKNKDNIDSLHMRNEVNDAIDMSKDRNNIKNIRFNSELTHDEIITEIIEKADNINDILSLIYEKYNLSIRGIDKILKVARTIADVEKCSNVRKSHIIEALNYRRFINDEII